MRGLWQEALAELEAATRLAPDVANGWNNLGSVYLALQRPADAVRAFRRALEAGSGEAVVRRNLAGALLEMGDLPEARRQIEITLRLSPADPAGWLRLGRIASAQGDAPTAREAYRRALALDPTLEAARKELEEQR